jgi:hypothetical protein
MPCVRPSAFGEAVVTEKSRVLLVDDDEIFLEATARLCKMQASM